MLHSPVRRQQAGGFGLAQAIGSRQQDASGLESGSVLAGRRRGNRSRGGMEGAGSSHPIGQLGPNMALPTGQSRAQGGNFGPRWRAPSRPANGYPTEVTLARQ